MVLFSFWAFCFAVDVFYFFTEDNLIVKLMFLVGAAASLYCLSETLKCIKRAKKQHRFYRRVDKISSLFDKLLIAYNEENVHDQDEITSELRDMGVIVNVTRNIED